MNAVITKHKLNFEVADWKYDKKIKVFRVGTCNGQFFWNNAPGFGPVLCLLSVVNDKPGNGHLEDVFEWFEGTARREQTALMIMDFQNERFKKHCINKRGYEDVPGTDHVFKLF